jgi:hypothetical protein
MATRGAASVRVFFFAMGLIAMMFPASGGCAHTGYPLGTENARPLVMDDAERDLDCPKDDIRVKELWGGLWEAVGCGQKMRYTSNCDSIRCEVHPEGEAAVPFRDRPEPQEMPR